MATASHKILRELGIVSFYNSSLDTKTIILQRFIRFFAFGGSTIILVLYLNAIDVSDTRTGLFMSLTLVGDIFSFALTLLADGLGRKVVLGGGALLMALSGIVFGRSENYWVLLAASMFGIISPNGRDIGPFSAIEESVLAHLTEPSIRSDIFAWYTVIGSAGSACGKLATGWVVQRLEALEGWDQMRAYHVVFSAYAFLGVINFLLACTLSSKVELKCAAKRVTGVRGIGQSESEPLLAREDDDEECEKRSWKSLLPKISNRSRITVIQLCLLFAVDSLASGLVPASWVTYFFHFKFNLPVSSLGTLFFATGLLAAFSSLIAASISKRIGLVRTMVFTHLPSAIALALITAPSSLPWAIFFLVIRSSLASMDIAPKAAFLSAVLLPEERTAVMGIVSLVRQLAQSCGPVVTGMFAQNGVFWATFVVAGILKASYDMVFLLAFVNFDGNHVDGGAESVKRDEEEVSDTD